LSRLCLRDRRRLAYEFTVTAFYRLLRPIAHFENATSAIVVAQR